MGRGNCTAARMDYGAAPPGLRGRIALLPLTRCATLRSWSPEGPLLLSRLGTAREGRPPADLLAPRTRSVASARPHRLRAALSLRTCRSRGPRELRARTRGPASPRGFRRDSCVPLAARAQAAAILHLTHLSHGRAAITGTASRRSGVRLRPVVPATTSCGATAQVAAPRPRAGVPRPHHASTAAPVVHGTATVTARALVTVVPVPATATATAAATPDRLGRAIADTLTAACGHVS